MKKLLLTLGSIAAVAAPVASVVACGAPAQKHVPLDKSVVTKQLPALKSALETAFAGGADSTATGPSVDDGTVVEKDGGFEVTFKIQADPKATDTDDLVITIAADGKIKAVTPPAAFKDALPADFKDQLETLMTAATVDHSGDSTEEIKLDKTKFDDAVITAAGLTFPAALPAGATNDEIRTQDALVTTFGNAYEQAVADQVASILSAITSSSLTQDAYLGFTFGSISNPVKLTEDIMKKLGMEQSVIDEVKRLQADGADIQVSRETAGGDIASTIMCNGNQGTWNYVRPTSFGTATA